jgi:queuosine precursor transporter
LNNPAEKGTDTGLSSLPSRWFRVLSGNVKVGSRQEEHTMRTTSETKKLILLALYITSMVLVNTLGSKITTILGIRVSVGIFFMPLLFLIMDIVTEIFGHKTSTIFVNISTAMLAFMFLMMWLCIGIKPHPVWGLQESYAAIFGSSMRMTVASLISFFVAQYVDLIVFSLLRKMTKEKHLWIRNNVSTILSQFIDTTIFMFIAFYHINEKYTAGFIFSLILPYWLFKIVFALLDTPFCYLGVWWFKRGMKDSGAGELGE